MTKTTKNHNKYKLSRSVCKLHLLKILIKSFSFSMNLNKIDTKNLEIKVIL